MTPFTFFHVLLSLVGILSGFVILYGLLVSDLMRGWTAVFLATTLATSVTGFLFPFHGVTPGIIFGILSLVVLAAVIGGRYAFHLAGPWRWIYAAGSAFALYLNVFVLVAQAFGKIRALHALAPTTPPSGPAFGAAQGLVLVIFLVLGILAVRRFHPITQPA
jgi:hypothetical protein